MLHRVFIGSVAILALVTTVVQAQQPSVQELIANLRSEDAATRHSAATELGQLGSKASAAVPALVEALDSDDEALRFEAIHSLGDIGSAAKSAVPALKKLVQEDKPFQSVLAVRAMRSIQLGGDVPPLLGMPILVKALTGDDELARNEAAVVLSESGHAAVPPLITVLESTQPANVRALAAAALARIGREARSATPALARRLSDSDEKVRWRSAQALSAIGPEAAEAVNALVAALSDPSANVRVYAVDALGEIGVKSDAVVTGLAKAVTDKEPLVRRQAVSSLAQLRPGPQVMVPLMTKVLSDADPSVVMPAVQAMAAAGERAIPGVIEALKNEKSQYWAALILSEMGPKAKEAVPALIEVAKTGKEEARLEAYMAFASIGADAKSAAAQIATGLTDKMVGVRYAATYAAGAVGVDSPQIISGLEANLKVDDPFLQMVSAWALAQLQPKNEPAQELALKLLAEGLVSDQPRMRSAAVNGLAHLQPGAKAIPYYVKALAGADESTREFVVDSVAAVGAKALPGLIPALGTPELRQTAARIIQKIGAPAKQAQDALIKALQEEARPDVQASVMFALGSVDPDVEKALPVTMKMLEQGSGQTRHAAVYTLGRFGPAASSAVPILKDFMGQTDDEFLRRVSAWALVHIQPKDPETVRTAVPMMIAVLKNDSRANVRAEAARTLGQIGIDSPAAEAALKAAMEDSDESVAQAAKASYKTLTGESE